jgi:NAD-dependent deacetylase
MPHVDPARRRHRQPNPPEPTDTFAIAAASLRAAEHVCILTGAGISAESGIPTFRDAMTGLWSRYSPDALATPTAFAENPELVWKWYAERRARVRQAEPNAAHQALVHLVRFVSHCTLVTQNVDDLHQRAGSRDIVSLHGSLMRARCSAGCARTLDPIPDADERIPLCANCGSLMRPDVVWFGEPLPTDALASAQAAALACDVFLSIGTSNVVEPAASLPWLAAKHGATVIVINPSMDGQRTGPSVLQLTGNAASVVPRLIERAFRGRRPRARRPDGTVMDDEMSDDVIEEVEG